MPRAHREPYTCIRCGYMTPHKSKMKAHLYILKNPCPGSKNLIDLTEDIKECILLNRVYHVKTVVHENIIQQQTINNYHHINNVVAGMDVLEKLMKYMSYKKVETLDFEQAIEDKYIGKVKRLENDKYKYGFHLKKTDLFEIIDEVTTACNVSTLEEFNILYDKKINRVKLYEQGTWQDLLVTSGLTRMMFIIKSYFLDAYECYLLRKLYSAEVSYRQKNEIIELLEEYFGFICSFDLEPYMKDRPDTEILYNVEDDRYSETCSDYSLSEKYYKVFKHICEKITKSEINAVKKEVLDILKRNTIKNIEELNKNMMSIFKVDQDFKEAFMKNYCI